MEQEYKKLSDAELELMSILWERGMPMTSSEIITSIQPPDRWAKTTILNFLGRLIEKGYLRTRKQGKVNVYQAQVSATDYRAREGVRVFKMLYGGSVCAAVESLFQCGAISEDDLLLLGDLVAQHTGRMFMEVEETEQPSEEHRWKVWYKRHFKL